MESLLTQTETQEDFEKRYNEEFPFEMPVIMGLATREEINFMTMNEIKYLNYKAQELWFLQHPEIERGD